MPSKRAANLHSHRRELMRAGSRAALGAACVLLVAGCGLGSAKFGDPKIPPPPPPAGGLANN